MPPGSMEARVALWLLLVLADRANPAWSRGGLPPPRQLQRRQGLPTGLSEFLQPPPPPPRLGRPPPPPPSPPPLPPTALRHTRNGRYVNQQQHQPVRDASDSTGYLYRLMNWLNPFRTTSMTSGKPLQDEPVAKASSYQPAQYAPRMPYTGGGYNYDPPPSPVAPSLAPTLPPNNNGYSSGLAAWMSGRPCNPCNQVPWVPIFRNDAHQGVAQYAPNVGYQSPGPANQGYSYPTPGNNHLQQPSQQYQPSPSLQNPQGPYPGVSPPVFDAKPFNAPPQEYSSPGQLHHPPPPLVPPNHQPSYFDEPGPANSHSFPSHGDESDHHHQSPEELESPPGDLGENGPLEHDGENPPFGANVDYSDQSGPGLYEERPSGPEPEHAESRPVQVNNQPLQVNNRPLLSHNSDTPTILPTRLFDPETGTSVHFQRSPLIDLTVAGESSHTTTIRPVYRPSPGHPQSSKEQQRTTLSPSTVIEYMVSAGDISSSEEERSVERWTTTTRPDVVTTQKLFTTTRQELVDQRHQESRIETLVQSYEILRKPNRTTSSEEEREEEESQQLGQVTFNETEDSSASKEVVVADKPENGKRNKQVIQIIIPYTSQYTASPFHPTRPANLQSATTPTTTTTSSSTQTNLDLNYEDNAVIEESRRVSVTRHAPQRNISVSPEANAIDVHRLQKNIDNWTIQEYSKSSASVTKRPNSTYPRWLSSKSIPDEYLLTVAELEESSEYYDFSNETKLQRGTNYTEDLQQYQESTTPEPTTQRVNIVTAIYSKNPKKYESHPSRAPPPPPPPPTPPPPSARPTPAFNRSSSEKVYVVTPVPISDAIASGTAHPNSLEQLYAKDESAKGKPQRDVEQAYQVLPQAVNNLAVLSSPPDSAAPVLWGIMEHEQLAASPDQPRWRSESDLLPEPPDTPVLYAGHSKVSRAR